MEHKITIEDHIKATEKSVEVIAHVRRMAELDGLDMDEFDRQLNELCKQKHQKFAKMDLTEVALYGLKILLEAGKGGELISAMIDKE